MKKFLISFEIITLKQGDVINNLDTNVYPRLYSSIEEAIEAAKEMLNIFIEELLDINCKNNKNQKIIYQNNIIFNTKYVDPEWINEKLKKNGDHCLVASTSDWKYPNLNINTFLRYNITQIDVE